MAALKLEHRPVELRTDSKHVAEGFNKHMERRSRQRWMFKGRKIKNADLLEELCTISTTRLPGTVPVKKVKGHTTEEDMHKGVVQAEDKDGNDAADALAVAGAFENDRKTVSKNLRVQMDATLAVQRMMLSILQLQACKQAEHPPQQERTSHKSSEVELTESEDGSNNSCNSGSSSSTSRSQAERRSRRSRRRHRGRAAPAAAE